MRRSFGRKVAVIAARVSFFSASITFVSVLVASGASAATFSIAGGDPSSLNSSFNPTPTFAADNFNIKSGSPITVFNNGNAGGGNGLFVTAPGPLVNLKYTYVGSEASYENLFEAAFSVGAALFDNKTSTVGNNQTFNNQATGLVPALFESVTPGDKVAINGTSVDTAVEIAFAVVNGGHTAYAFLEDIAIGGDSDFDDMVVRIDATDIPANQIGLATPLPATVWLFGSAIAGGVGVGRWRKSRKSRKAA